ncbi:MAG: Na/Pi cotransporter family protein [Lachnospiraceae bacterium]|nr:Na/Pi cotransporter family protein [Lachnospiraceae bacterium]
MNETLKTVFGLLGGLALFLYGMNMMSDGLQKAAGEKMKAVLGFLTKNPIMGVLAGALTTAVLQSSSATTVMVIGFVSANLMTLPQAISVILGANIGTTMTAQLIAFKISDYIWPILFIGFLINMISKNEKVKNIGITIFAFGVLFVGIETMGDVMKPLAASPVFTDLMAKVGHIPVLGVLLGACMTLVVQSSSATIAVLQNFASQAGPDGIHSALGLAGAIPILFGDNIGTTITALLASIGQSKNAKRTAIAHSVFNIAGTLIFIWFIPLFAKFVQYISPKGAELDIIARQIANAHTCFNVINTLIWIPFIWVLVKIVCFIIPDKGNEEIDEMQPLFLDRNVIHQPVFALNLLSKEIEHYSNLISRMLQEVKTALIGNDIKMAQKAKETGNAIQALQEAVNAYMALLFAEGTLTEEQASHATDVIYVIEDMGKVSLRLQDVLDITEIGEKNAKFSKEAVKEIEMDMDNVIELYHQCSRIFLYEEPINMIAIKQRERDIHEIKSIVRANHKERVNSGTCKMELTLAFSNVFTNLERISHNCVNIAEAAQNNIHLNYLNEQDEETEEVKDINEAVVEAAK